MLTMFKESDGLWSMRRGLAFLLALAGIAAGIIAVLKGSAWTIVAAAFGVPGGLAALLLFFTTWADIRGIVSAVKGVKCGE